MVKVRKRASKRVSTKQKAKITKKVKEHTRKSKRNAKKDPTWKSKKKVDPGIPNNYPYKEQLLNEIERKRMVAEQAKKDARDAQLNEKKNQIEVDDDMEQDKEEFSSPEASTSILAPATPRQFRGTFSAFYSSLESEDNDPHVLAIVVLLDARDPLSWRLSDLEEKMRSSKRHLIIALTKVDLVPFEVVTSWIAYLSATIKCPVFPICSPEPARNGIKARAGGGIATLSAFIEKTCCVKGKAGGEQVEKEEDAIAILGIENCGKTLLARNLALLLPSFNIIDTPPIVAASSRQAHLSTKEQEEEEEDDDDDDAEDQKESDEKSRLRDQKAAHRILIRNSGSIYKVREPLPLVHALMERVLQVSDLMMTFNVPAFSTTDDFLIAVARTQGRLKKGAVPDTIAAARHILRGWSTGVVGYYSKPPSGVEGVEEARDAILKDKSLKNVLLSRKDWRQAWKGKELRLTTGSGGLLDGVKIAFAKSADVEEGAIHVEGEGGEEEDDDDDDEVDFDEDDDDDDEVDFDEDDDDEEEDEDDE